MMTTHGGDDVYTPSAAAELLKVSEFTVLRMLRTGKLKGFKVLRQWRTTRLDIDRFMKTQGSEGINEPNETDV